MQIPRPPLLAVGLFVVAACSRPSGVATTAADTSAADADYHGVDSTVAAPMPLVVDAGRRKERPDWDCAPADGAIVLAADDAPVRGEAIAVRWDLSTPIALSAERLVELDEARHTPLETEQLAAVWKAYAT